MDVLIWLEPNIRMESKIERELSRKNLMKILIFLEGGARQNVPIIPKRKMPFCGNDFPALYHQDLLVQQNSTSFNFSPLWMLTFPLFSWVQQSHLHPAWPRPSQFLQPTCSWKLGGEPVQPRPDEIILNCSASFVCLPNPWEQCHSEEGLSCTRVVQERRGGGQQIEAWYCGICASI